MARSIDVLIIGAGQAGLATAYYLRRYQVSVLLVDAHPTPGGSWPDTWPSLKLFSPARISSLPGWRLPATAEYYPTPAEITAYFEAYEQRYGFEILRPATVAAIERDSVDQPFSVVIDEETIEARTVICCTGNASRPFVPFVPGRDTFTGTQVHSHDYRGPQDFQGDQVVVVGGGNSGAQVVADLALAKNTTVTWCTLRPPRLLPDSYDGEALFSVARTRLAAIESGQLDPGGLERLGDIVAVEPVRIARDAGLLPSRPMFSTMHSTGISWPDGSDLTCDAIIWCTGFRPALSFLAPLGLKAGRGIQLSAGQSVEMPGLFFVGYGDWVGPAADTIVGVSPFAKQAAAGAAAYLSA